MHALTSTRGARRTMHWFWAMAALLAVWASAWPVQAQQAPGQWGLRLLATHVLPPEAVARFAQFQQKSAQTLPAAAQPGEPLAGSETWQGQIGRAHV